MIFTSETMAELNLLLKFPDTSLMQGIKVHQDADPELIAASQRLFDKGIVTLPDGGYLTDLGHDLLEHTKIIGSAFSLNVS